MPSVTTEAPASSRPVLLGHYQVIKTLVGGMGIVYLCVDVLDHDRPVAVKTFRPELMADLEARKRFLQEGSVWVNLGFHPNIVQAFRVERDERMQVPYLALELIPALQGMPDASLRSWLRSHGSLPLRRALEIVLGIVRGMKFSCSKIPTLVHRDLKPENVLIGLDGSARITDFGLATVLGAREGGLGGGASPSATMHTKGAVGTPLYMSPEQWREEALDERSDIYSLGLIMLEMIKGRHVVAMPTLAELAEAHARGMALEVVRGMDLPRVLRPLAESLVYPDRSKRAVSWTDVERVLLAIWPDLFSEHAPEDTGAVEVGRFGEIQRGGSFLAIGGAYVDIGELRHAEEHFSKALAIGRQQRYSPLVAAALANQGVLRAEQGKFQESIPLYDEAIALFRAIGVAHNVVMNTGNLGNAHLALGHLVQARQSLEAALAGARLLGDKEGEARWLGNLGNVAVARADYATAHRLFREALDISERTGSRLGFTTALLGLALVKESSGSPREALHLYRRALEIAEATADPRIQALAAGGLGNAHMKLNQPHLATEGITRALEIARVTGNLWLQASSLGNLAAAHIALGEHEVALQEIESAIRIADSIGARDISARAKWSEGIALLTAGRAGDAMPRLRKALREYKELGMPQYGEASLQLQQLEKRFANA